LRDKRLLDVGKALKIKGFSATEKPPKSHRKATEKTTEKHQTVENQALAKILFGFSVCRKDPPTKPADPPTRWHDFCSQKHDFFYTFL
jgi:hypothetical protein